MGSSVMAVPQSVSVGSLLLVVNCVVEDNGLRREFFGNNDEEIVYPSGLGYIRWGLESPGGGQGGVVTQYENVQGTFNELAIGERGLESQPWWGDKAAADALALQLGQEHGAGENDLGNPNDGFFGPWLAYGVDGNGSIRVTTYTGGGDSLAGDVVQSSDNTLWYLRTAESGGGEGVRYLGSWFPVVQENVAIPVSYSGDLALFFEALERPGVSISGEFVSL